MLWHGQNAMERTRGFGLNRPLGSIHTKDARFFRLRKFCCGYMAIYQSPIHLNGARWRTTFFRRRTSRCLQNLVRQRHERVPFKCMGFWYIRSRISAAEKTRVFGVNRPLACFDIVPRAFGCTCITSALLAFKERLLNWVHVYKRAELLSYRVSGLGDVHADHGGCRFITRREMRRMRMILFSGGLLV